MLNKFKLNLIDNTLNINKNLKINGENLFDLMFPVGSIYLNINNISPCKTIGGSWLQLNSDAYLKIITNDNSLDANTRCGGTSIEHKIPQGSMPAHKHTIVLHAFTGSRLDNRTYYGLSYQTGNGNRWSNIDSNDNNEFGHNYLENSGSSEPYYPYYYGVYAWLRVE